MSKPDKIAKLLERLETVGAWTSIVSAVAPIFPEDSRLRGLFAAIGPGVKETRNLIQLNWVNQHVYGFESIRSRPLLSLARTHGRVVARYPAGDGDYELIEIGRARVLANVDAWSQMRSSVPHGDLVIELFGVLAASGRAGALRLTRESIDEDWTAEFEPDAPLGMSGFVEAIARDLAPELAIASRSVLLWGASGLGKSVAARQLARLVDGPTIVLDAGVLVDSEAWTMVTSLEPACLIVEDIDHGLAPVASMVLGQLERVRATVRLVVMTANAFPRTPDWPEDEQDPISRTGRIDRVYKMDVLDRGLARTIADLPVDLLDIAVSRGFSGSDVAELAVRWRAHPTRRAKYFAHLRVADGLPRDVLDSIDQLEFLGEPALQHGE